MARRAVVPPEKSLAFQIRRAHLAFDRMLTMRLARLGVKTGFWYYLRALWIQEGITQKRLSQVTNVTEGTTVSLLNDMTHQGLIDRERDTVDRRKVFVSLTSKGRALEAKLLPQAMDLLKVATNGISSDELAVCMSVLQRVAENLETGFKDAENS